MVIEDEDENGITALSNDHVTQDIDSGQTRQGNGMNDISIGGKLTAEQQTQLKDVINKFPDVSCIFHQATVGQGRPDSI